MGRDRDASTVIAEANLAATQAFFRSVIGGGVQHVIASPGSRSTPLIVAAAEAAAAGGLQLHVVLDERSAGFAALGVALQTGRPAVLACTSGTAAVNFAPAVIEAGLSAVPMIIATADRPPELRGRGAPQTIDQLELYGSSVRWFVDLPPPDDADVEYFSRIGSQACERSERGPVHLNFPFREPLLPTKRTDPCTSEVSGARGAVSRPRDGGGRDGGAHQRARTGELPLPSSDIRRGVMIAGGRNMVDRAALDQLVAHLGWPVIADPLSGMRDQPNAITAADALLRSDWFADNHLADFVIRVGRPPASKAVAQWIAQSRCPLIQVGGPGLIDPDHNVTSVCDLATLAALPAGGSDIGEWAHAWRDANGRAESAIEEKLAAEARISEPLVARSVATSLHPDEQLVVSSSMPVRDLEWYGGPEARAIANRGANGIDGVMSTGLGVAMSGAPTKVLIGDLAFIHDANALVGAGERAIDLTIVVNDNDGGGIFSFLPQADLLTRREFEQLFGTPNGTDIPSLALSHGVECNTVHTADELTTHLRSRRSGVRVVRIVTDREENVAVHHRLNQAVAKAVDLAP